MLRSPRTFYTGSAFGVPATGANYKLLAKSVCVVKLDLDPAG